MLTFKEYIQLPKNTQQQYRKYVLYFFRDNPTLWKVKSKNYPNRQKRSDLLLRLSNKIKCDVTTISKIWNYLRDTYRKIYVAKEEFMNNASETPDCNKHPWNHWPYFSDMSFINSEYVNRKVKSKDAESNNKKIKRIKGEEIDDFEIEDQEMKYFEIDVQQMNGRESECQEMENGEVNDIDAMNDDDSILYESAIDISRKRRYNPAYSNSSLPTPESSPGMHIVNIKTEKIDNDEMNCIQEINTDDSLLYKTVEFALPSPAPFLNELIPSTIPQSSSGFSASSINSRRSCSSSMSLSDGSPEEKKRKLGWQNEDIHNVIDIMKSYYSNERKHEEKSEVQLFCDALVPKLNSVSNKVELMKKIEDIVYSYRC